MNVRESTGSLYLLRFENLKRCIFRLDFFFGFSKVFNP